MNGKSIPSPMTPPGGVRRFGARVFDDPRHDPYQASAKYREPIHCSQCGAVYKAGRWQWTERSATSIPGTCPACKRIHDGLPAGRLTLEGPYLAAHEKELVQIARHQAEQERAEHALHRIMNIESRPGSLEITTTDIHLPRRIGEALARAHDGELTIRFSEDAYEIEVRWHR
jgi:hypothetical protein